MYESIQGKKKIAQCVTSLCADGEECKITLVLRSVYVFYICTHVFYSKKKTRS